jgi:phenylpyruvate tautomerase PptA (4-oxalocrotonate tautomerase family)
MPLVRIHLPQGSSPEIKRHVSDAIHRALVETFKVPEDDRFQVISEHGPDDLACTPAYLGIVHSAQVVFVQITCSEGRSVQAKKDLFQRMAELIATNGTFAAADVIINLVEVKKENWSFGNGIAQYA